MSVVQSKTRKPFSMDWYVLGTFASFLGNQSNANISSGGEGFFQTTVQSAPQYAHSFQLLFMLAHPLAKLPSLS